MNIIVFEVIGLINSIKIKLFLLLITGCIALFCFLQHKKKLSVHQNVCLLITAFAALLLIFSRVFSSAHKYYNHLFSSTHIKIYGSTFCISITTLLLLWIIPKFYLKNSEKQNTIKRWAMLKNFPLSILTEKKRNEYLTHIVYTLTLLGANAKADEYAKEIINFKKSEFYHLLKTQKAYLQGNIDQEIQFSDAAVLSINKRTKTLYEHQFYINKAFGYFIRHDYKNADRFYKEAYKFIRSKKIKNIQLIFKFYKNFLINKVCLNTNQNEVQKYLEEFKKYIKNNNAEHWMLYFDLELAVLQQLRASKREFELNIENSLNKIEELKMKEDVRSIYIIKVARIITSCSANPEHCIRLLTNRKKYLPNIPFREKYTAYKDLDYLFSNLRGPILGCVQDLIIETKRYFFENAENEINSYLENMPLEAVYEQIYFTKELAWLRRLCAKEYEFSSVKEYLKSAINLCEENKLLKDAMIMRLDIADEALAPCNLNEYSCTKYTNDIKENADIVAKFAVKMRKGPLEAEFDFRLSYYYLRIHDYKNHIRFYERFKKSNCPKEFFAAWCRIYIGICDYTYTVLKTLDALESISKSKQVSSFSSITQQFLKSYISSDGLRLSVILGMSLRTDFILKKCTIIAGTTVSEHWWLLNSRHGMEVDPLYKNFRNDENTERLFFIPQTHPLQTKESIIASNSSSVKIEEIPKSALVLDENFLLLYAEIIASINYELRNDNFIKKH